MTKHTGQSAVRQQEPLIPELIDSPRDARSAHDKSHRHQTEIELLAHWMDTVFQIPGLPVRFGFDALLGLLPGFGDTATSIVSLYILHAASRMGVSRVTMTRMAMNIALDYAVGAVPVLGDAFDVYWKANRKNVELIRRDLSAGLPGERRRRASDWLFLGGLALVLLTILVGSVTIAWAIIAWLGAHLFSAK